MRRRQELLAPIHVVFEPPEEELVFPGPELELLDTIKGIFFGLSPPVLQALSIYSQVLFLNPRLLAFSDTARLVWSETPSGNSAMISTLTVTVA